MPTSIIHGWDDELIPAQAVVDWAHARRARLLLVDDTHRLSEHVEASAEAFAQLLQTHPKSTSQAIDSQSPRIAGMTTLHVTSEDSL